MSLTKQEMQACIDNARMRIIDHIPTRQDIQILKENTRNLTSLISQSQQIITQGQRHNAELTRRVASLDARLAQLESNIHELHRVVVTVANRRPQEKVTERVVVQSAEEHQRYNYGLQQQPNYNNNYPNEINT